MFKPPTTSPEEKNPWSWRHLSKMIFFLRIFNFAQVFSPSLSKQIKTSRRLMVAQGNPFNLEGSRVLRPLTSFLVYPPCFGDSQVHSFPASPFLHSHSPAPTRLLGSWGEQHRLPSPWWTAKSSSWSLGNMSQAALRELCKLFQS